MQDHLGASGSNIIVNSLAPGFVLTSFVPQLPENIREEFVEVAKVKAYNMEEGGRFLLQAALLSAEDSEKEKELKGAFFSIGQISELSEFGKGEVGKKIQQKLWVSGPLVLLVRFGTYVRN